MQFNSELDSAKAQLTEEAEAAANAAEARERANAQLADMARGLVVAIGAAEGQKLMRKRAQAAAQAAAADLQRARQENRVLLAQVHSCRV